MDQDDPQAYSDLAGFGGDWRDSWYHEDFVELMAWRWRLSTVGRALDVGCGVGHWGQHLARYFADDAVLVGIDSQAAFLDQARVRAAERGLSDRCEWLAADVMDLPFPDDSFDFVTCQTVLMHLADPAGALREMRRVVRPGGLIAAAEPHNLLSAMAELFEDAELDDRERLELLAFEMAVFRGKMALGQGDSSIALRVPGLMGDAGLSGIQAWHSDMCALALPPYDAKVQADVNQRLSWIASDAMIGGTRADARKRFVAGGGREDDFDALWERARSRDLRLGEAMKAGTWRSAGAFTMLLVSGRK